MMFDPFIYLESRRAEIGKRSEPVRKIIRITGLSNLEELMDDVRNNEYPCIAVDMGADGRLDMSAGTMEVTFHTLYVLLSVDAAATQAQCYEVLQRARRIGRAAINMMVADAHELHAPCYGLQSENITFNSFGPVGMQCYGYSFSYTIANDNA